MIVHVPGLDNAKAFARTGAVGLLNMKQAFAKNAADRGDRRDDRQAAADLQRSSTPTRPTPQDDQPDDRAGQGARRGSHVRRSPCAGCGTRTARDPGRAGLVRRSCATTAPLPANERAQRGRYARIFAALKRAGIARAVPVRGLGLHRRLGEEPDLAAAVDPQQRVRAARRSQPRRRQGAGARARLHGHEQPARSSADADRVRRRAGHVPGAVLPRHVRPTPRHRRSITARAGPTRCRRRSPGNVATAQFECIVPASATPLEPGADLAVRPRAARSTRRGHRQRGFEALATQLQHGVLRDGLVGARRPPTPRSTPASAVPT